jgi:hypothetical protein
MVPFVRLLDLPNAVEIVGGGKGDCGRSKGSDDKRCTNHLWQLIWIKCHYRYKASANQDRISNLSLVPLLPIEKHMNIQSQPSFGRGATHRPGRHNCWVKTQPTVTDRPREKAELERSQWLHRVPRTTCCPGRAATRGSGKPPADARDATPGRRLLWLRHPDNKLSGLPGRHPGTSVTANDGGRCPPYKLTRLNVTPPVPYPSRGPSDKRRPQAGPATSLVHCPAAAFPRAGRRPRGRGSCRCRG